MPEERERIHPATRAEWRRWLEAHHDVSPGVWLVQWRPSMGHPRLAYNDIIEEALCFGWVDSRAAKLDEERSMIMMTPRRPTSAWAQSNKERVERLRAEGRMAAAGMRAVDAAKANGSWAMLDDVDALVVPDDLRSALAGNERARQYFDAFPPSAKKLILHWVKSAKRADTRQRRIRETVRLAAENIRAPLSGTSPGRRPS